MKFSKNFQKTKGQLTSIYPEYPISNRCLTILCGKTGSGKSAWVKKIINEVVEPIVENTKVVFISPTVDLDELMNDEDVKPIEETNSILKSIMTYKKQEKTVKNHFKTLCNFYDVLNENDYKMIKLKKKDRTIQLSPMAEEFRIFYTKNKKYLDYDDPTILEMRDKCKSFCLVFDDCAGQEVLKDGSELTKFIMTRRHYHTSIFLAVQYFKQLIPKVRAQTSDIVVFQGIRKETLKDIYNEVCHEAVGDNEKLFNSLIKKHVVDGPKYSHICFMMNGCDDKPHIMANYDLNELVK